MSLTFLVPLFLLGLAGVAVPVIVHLTRRQRRNVVPFPSLLFLQRIPFQEQRRRRIHHWLLLLLRAAALALVALAFARPFMEGEAADGVGAAGPTEVVVLLDRSYSMERGAQMEAARDSARRILDDLGPLDRGSVVAFDQGASVVLRSSTDRGRLRAAVDSVRAGSGATRYGPALKVAQTVLEESDLPYGTVYLLSDFQRIGWRGDEGVHLPAGARLVPVDVGTPLAENVMVRDVRLTRQSVSGRERTTVAARVVRRGGESPRDVQVDLEVDGRPLATATVTLSPDGAEFALFGPVTLSHPHTTGTVRVPPDQLPADDALHFVASPGEAVRVLLVDGARARPDAGLYIADALEVTDDGRFEVVRRRQDGIRPADLEGADVVILNEARIDGASAERLRTFVEDGGGLLVVAGERASWPASAADLLPAPLGSPEDRQEGRGGRLGFLEYGHPVFEAFAGPRSGDFTGARFFRARRVLPDSAAGVLARYDDGSAALLERRAGRGRTMLWTSTMDAFWNDLALQPVFLPFVHRLTEHLSGRTEALPWFHVGQVVDLADPVALRRAGLASRNAAGLDERADVVVLTPSGASLPLPAGDAGPRYLTLEERGFYIIRPPGTDPEHPFSLAVNPDLEESRLERLDVEALVASVTAPPTAAPDGPGFLDATALRREDRERRQSLWRYLLAAAFVLFMSETVLSNWASRRAVHRGGAT